MTDISEILKAAAQLAAEALPDSVEIGNSKTGTVKVYFDSSRPDEAEKRILAAVGLLRKTRGLVYSEG